jgi:hypothetical protein
VGEVGAFHATIQVLVREADQVRQVVEPLQSATDRVGRVADKLPGAGLESGAGRTVSTRARSGLDERDWPVKRPSALPFERWDTTTGS